MEQRQTRHNRRHGRENRLDVTHAADDVVVPQPELAVRQATELVGEILLVEAALEVDQPVLALHAETPGKTLVRDFGCGGGRDRRGQPGHVNRRAVFDRHPNDFKQ